MASSLTAARRNSPCIGISCPLLVRWRKVSDHVAGFCSDALCDRVPDHEPFPQVEAVGGVVCPHDESDGAVQVFDGLEV
jgi:hypothetical protein